MATLWSLSVSLVPRLARQSPQATPSATDERSNAFPGEPRGSSAVRRRFPGTAWPAAPDRSLVVGGRSPLGHGRDESVRGVGGNRRGLPGRGFDLVLPRAPSREECVAPALPHLAAPGFVRRTDAGHFLAS